MSGRKKRQEPAQESARETEHHMANPLARGAEQWQQAERQPPQHAEGRPLSIEQIFAAVDQDRDGSIDFGEFAEYWGAKQMQTRGNADENALNSIWTLFEKYDSDGSDGLNLVEFRELITEMATREWRAMKDSRGRTYYVNPITRESQWKRPGVAEFLQQQGIVRVPATAARPAVEISSVQDEAVVDGDDAEVHMVLNMWKIYIKMERQNRKRHYTDAFTYLIYTMVLMATMILNAPVSATLLAHQEALTDLLLDEEFQGVANHKKSWYDVMTPEEMWEWIEGPLHDAIYSDAAHPDHPAPLLGSNELLGPVQLRQVRVEPTRCISRNWAPFTYGNPDEETPLPGRACAGTYPTVERTFGGEAMFEGQDAALEKFREVRADWTDPGGAQWNAATQGTDVGTDAWAGAAEWYADWGPTLLEEDETRKELQGSPVFVESFLGSTSRNRFGKRGYAVNLPRNRVGWEAQVTELQGEGDKQPFIDKYTRVLAVTFNLYNGNDFDWDEEELFSDVRSNVLSEDDKHDDQIVFAQVIFTFGPSGHIEKYQRFSIVRFMRTYGYLDSTFKLIVAYLFALMAVTIFMAEVRSCVRMGIMSYFFRSENSVWNLYEVIFFGTFVMMQYSVLRFGRQCSEVDAQLTSLAEKQELDTTFVDLHLLKSDFRDLMRRISQLVFLSIFKSFKYMSLSDNLNFMYKILLRAKTEIFGFMAVYAILIGCFALFSQQLLGYELRNFHNFQASMVSLVRLSVGILDFDYTLLKEADSFWSPIFILAFVFFCMLTAINMFIAILSEYYELVKAESLQLKEDIQIFESQGMTVPSASAFDGFSTLWSNFWLRSRLMVESDPPHVPAEVIPVRSIVGPTWGQDKQQLKDAGGLTCYPNVHDNASNLVRIHLYSEFVPTELENLRGKARANIPILGEVSQSRGFRSFCVGLGDARSPINELISSYGKLWSEHMWICGICKHTYDPERDGGGKTMEDLHASEKTWVCPECEPGAQEWDVPRQHTGHKFSYYRQDTGKRTVCCLQLHPDDMHSEVRPQVLLKMRPRFSTVPNAQDGSQDPDYENQCDDPDVIVLQEDSFGAQIKLELLIFEEMKEDIVYGGKCIGKARDIFALFRVAEVSSWEHFANEPTKLKKAPGMWRKRDDQLLFEMSGAANGKQAMSEKMGSGQFTNSQMAEMFSKTERQVDLRRRFLRRLHKDANGLPVTPKVLRMTFQPHWRTTLRIWGQARQDEAMKVVSASYFRGLITESCRCKHYADPHMRDIKRFIRHLTQYVLDELVENRKDITELEAKFLSRNMELDEAIGQMKVYLVNSGARNMNERSCRCCGIGGSRTMLELYGDPQGDLKTVEIKNELGQLETLTVDDKIKRWLMQKYALEIDAVVVIHDGEEDEDNQMIVTPGGHRQKGQGGAMQMQTDAAAITRTLASGGDRQRPGGRRI